MLLHLFLDSCQKEIKLSLIVYNGNLLGGDFVDKSLALTFDDLTSELILARDKKISRYMSNKRLAYILCFVNKEIL